MRNSNSRQKPSNSTYSQNRLMKTQVPPKSNTKQALNSTQYKLPPQNPSSKRIESSKSTNVSTKQIPRQQLNFDIENNMTESKLITAKQSLQLLKKKMNRTGMSREKPSTQTQNAQSTQQKTVYEPLSMKKIKSQSNKNLQNYQPIKQQPYGTQYSSKQMAYEPNNYKSSSKKITEPQKRTVMQRPLPKRPVVEQYSNEVDQVPIATKKVNFQELIERELKKQQAMKNNSSGNSGLYRNQPKQQQNWDVQEYADQGQLIECSKGCERKFNANAIAKHQKICEKVFQSKRKAFNTAAQRQIETEGFQKPPPVTNPLNQTKKTTGKVQEKNGAKIPKWKLQSAQLRVGLKAISNKPLTSQQKALTNMQNDALVPCNFCGRKFNQTAAARHIPVCQNKAKQMARTSNGRKK